MKFSIKQISEILKIEPQNLDYSKKITAVKIDSRLDLTGALFVAIKGKNFNANEFALAAKKNGAVAFLLTEKNNSLPNVFVVEDTVLAMQTLAKEYLRGLKAKTIAITGSVGKTTTKDMLAFMLEKKFNVTATIGNLNNHIGVPLMIFEADETTDFCVLELGISNFGEMRVLAEIVNPDIGMILNIGKAHLEKLKDLEGVLLAKWELAEFCDVLFVNGDDLLLKQKPANFFADGQMLGLENGKQKVVIDGTEFLLNILGVAGFYAARAVYAVAKYLGFSKAEIVERLEDFRDVTAMRQQIEKINGINIFNDAYNANPTSMHAALRLFEEMEVIGKKVVLIGDMLELGEATEEEHRVLAKYLHNFDEVICFGDATFFTYLELEKKCFWSKNREEISNHLKSILQSGDCLFLKGSRGMKLEGFLNEEITTQI